MPKLWNDTLSGKIDCASKELRELDETLARLKQELATMLDLLKSMTALASSPDAVIQALLQEIQSNLAQKEVKLDEVQATINGYRARLAELISERNSTYIAEADAKPLCHMCRI